VLREKKERSINGTFWGRGKGVKRKRCQEPFPEKVPDT
jgi:hypothetical protein